MPHYDLVIRNGSAIDGSGALRRKADIAIAGERIAAIGEPGSLRSDSEFDAAGKIVAPGFIDVHTHDDTALIENPSMAMKASQGVSTVICGNCGASYHERYNRPKVEGVCDFCGQSQFIHRADDQPDTVRARLAVYHTQTAPILPYYRSRGLLRAVDGMAPPDQVTQAIEALLGPAGGRTGG